MCGLILMFLRKCLSPKILLSVRKNIGLQEADLCQNVPWSNGCLTQWWNLLGLIEQSDLLDAFNLLTVLYKPDTATEIVYVFPAVIRRVHRRTYISRLFPFFVVWVCWVGYLAFRSTFIVLGLSCFLGLFQDEMFATQYLTK